LGEARCDLSLTGFDEFELGELFAVRTQGRPIPMMRRSLPGTRSRSRAIYGCSAVTDCSAATAQWATDVARLLGGVAPHLMVTDPPYGVNYDPAWRNQAGRSINGTTRRIATGTVIKPIGARAVGKVVNDDRADWREAWALFPGSVAYIWHAGTKAGIVQDSLAACGFETRSQIIWAKNNFAIGRGHYHCKHEPCWYVVRKGSTASWVGDHSQTTLWQIDKNLKSETGHGTQKPVECMRRPIENNASPGQAVYEPFSGSGTTIIAAEMTGRVCHAIEIAPAYVDVAVKRWQDFTGRQAALDGDGRSFDTVAAQRAR
jgi:DNA modification methylase